METVLEAIAANNNVSADVVRQELEVALRGTEYAQMPLDDALAILSKKVKENL